MRFPSTRTVCAHAVVLLAAVLWGAMPPAQAQDRGPRTDVQVATITDWPDPSLQGLLREMGRRAPRLLPEVDSLALAYRYAARASAADWSFTLSWQPGARVLSEGRVLRRREGPQGVRMVSVELLADVIVAGQKEAELVVAVDSMRLRPLPQVYRFDVQVGYDQVFLDTPAGDARQYLRQGVTLANLRVERMGFDAETMPTRGQRQEPDVRERRPAPRPAPSVYEPRVRIAIGWRIGPDPYYVGRGPGGEIERRTERPREDVGRTPSGADERPRGADRSRDDDAPRGERGADDTARDGDRDGEASGEAPSRRGRDKSDRDEKDEDDEEDEEDLLVPALAAAAGVGLAAYAGGTVGLYGTGDTPIGLIGGYTHPRGGVQLQAAVNGSVITEDDVQRLTAKALGFYDVFASRVQPALGGGVQVTGSTVDPSVSVGLVGNLGPVVLYGGFDVVQQTPEVGVAYNFRHARSKENSAP